MKPLRFRSLPERISKAARLLLASASLSAFAFASPAHAADPLSDMKEIQESCGKETSETLVIYADKQRDKLVEDYDPEIQCKENMGDEAMPLSHNAREVISEVWRKRPMFIAHCRSEAESRKLGACRAVYSAMKDSYNYIHLQNSNFCTSLKTNLDAAIACGGLKKECEPQFKRVREIFSQYSKVKEEVVRAQQYLDHTVRSSEKARAKYEEDLKNLELEIKTRGLTGGANTLEAYEAMPDRPSLKASNGNANTKNLFEYYKALTSAEIPRDPKNFYKKMHQYGGRMISEHREAARQAAEFMRKLTLQVSNQAQVIDGRMIPSLDTMIAEIQKSGSVKPPMINGLNTAVPGITGAVGLGQQVLGPQQAPAAVNQLTGGHSAPSLAALAAVGAAGAALSNTMGSSSTGGAAAAGGAEPINSQAPAKPLPPPESVSLGDPGTEPLKGTPQLPKENVGGGVKTPDNTATPATGNYPAFGASDGSSRAIAGSRKKAAGAPPPAEAKPGGGDEAMSNFGSASMAPKPAPKSTQVSAGAEVANLLGQMKNLFNFDEGAPMPGGAPLPGGQLPLDAGLGAAPGAEGVPVAEAEAAPAEENAHSAAEPGAGEKEIHGSPFGKSDTSLFARVHKRHHRCMERGLVLYQLGERVE